jgi:hypothetical protein
MARQAVKLEVYDNNGLAFIRKLQPNGKWLEWPSPDRKAEEWVELNSGPRRKWTWTIV